MLVVANSNRFQVAKGHQKGKQTSTLKNFKSISGNEGMTHF